MSTPALGLFGINMGMLANMLKVTRAAEAAGYESVWTGEHVVLPDPQAPPSPAPPEVAMVDPAVSLAFLAAATETIKLGTGIIILPQRQPAVLAKSLASVDHLSNGRLLFGLGVGCVVDPFIARRRRRQLVGVRRAGGHGEREQFFRHGRILRAKSFRSGTTPPSGYPGAPSRPG